MLTSKYVGGGFGQLGVVVESAVKIIILFRLLCDPLDRLTFTVKCDESAIVQAKTGLRLAP